MREQIQKVEEEKEKEDEVNLFPLPSEWIKEFKTNWYRDNNSLTKKRRDEIWPEYERLCSMIYKYQRKAFEEKFKNWKNNLLECKEKEDQDDKTMKDIENNWDDYCTSAAE